MKYTHPSKHLHVSLPPPFFWGIFIKKTKPTDNAIPIEGWISDPTDNDLLHLIPMLEALQYTTDVRSLLGLRRGDVQATS